MDELPLLHPMGEAEAQGAAFPDATFRHVGGMGLIGFHHVGHPCQEVDQVRDGSGQGGLGDDQVDLLPPDHPDQDEHRSDEQFRLRDTPRDPFPGADLRVRDLFNVQIDLGKELLGGLHGHQPDRADIAAFGEDAHVGEHGGRGKRLTQAPVAEYEDVLGAGHVVQEGFLSHTRKASHGRMAFR